MAIIPPHIVDDIMQASRIEEVIGEFVQLKRAGSNLKGLSPFTDEKTPSFVVSPAKQIFKCFSTGRGGSVVTFLMEKEHYSYPEALRWLADKYGVQIPDDKPATAEELEAISERESLHIINEFARNHFADNLINSAEGKKIGLSYFLERGFRQDIIEKFQLGYCLNVSDDFTKAAQEKGFKLEYLEKVGLTKSKDERHFDFFRGRVMFPIHSVSGRVLGFGGRTLITDKKIAKYFNSPESIIYNKSEILYGLHYSKGDIIKYDNCFLCEGYTDVISMYQAGIQNVVSSSGTSLTKEQIRLVKRYTKNITILYDGDAAGIKASFRGIDLILEEGLNVKVVLFPEGEDPDSFAKKSTTSELEEYIKEHQQDFISFKADLLLTDGENDPIKRAELIKEIMYSVSLIPDQITRNVYLQSISQRFEMNEEMLTSELIKLRKNILSKTVNTTEERDFSTQSTSFPLVQPQTQQVKKEFEPKDDPSEFDLMRILVSYGPLAISINQLDENGKNTTVETSVAELIIHELAIDELVFDYPVYSRMHKLIAESLAEEVFLKASYFRKLEDQEIVRFATEIEMNQHELSHNWIVKHNIHTNTEQDKIYQAVMGSIYSFKISKLEQQIRNIRKEMNIAIENHLDDELMDLMAQQVTLEQIKQIIAKKMGR